MNLLLLALIVVLQASPIDRILAVVGGEPIMWSDVSEAMKLGLVPAPSAGVDPVRAALDALIARQLALVEVNRYLPPEPSPEAVEARVAAIRTRFSSAAEFDDALKAGGLTIDQVAQRVRDDLRIDAYLDQRFGVMLQPGDAELEAYFREHAGEFASNGVTPPFDQVRDAVRRRVVRSHRDALARDWVAGLRRRADVSDLYLSPK